MEETARKARQVQAVLGEGEREGGIEEEGRERERRRREERGRREERRRLDCSPCPRSKFYLK